MAEPISFDESNDVLNPPHGWTSEQCEVVSICRAVASGGIPLIISCWKLSREELDELSKTGRVWLTVVGTSMPPVILSGIKPNFTESEDAADIT
jgi:hypothetical protein